MKCSIILALAAGAFAVPQATITSAPSAPQATNLTPQVSCALNCKPGDVTCQAACLGIARPNASQVIDTNNCAAKCDQGNGSPEAATRFSNCVQGCIGSLFPSSQTAFAPGAAQGSAGASASGAAGSAGSSGARATGSGSPSGSPTGSGAGTQTTGAADVNSARLAGAGLAGLLAIFAL